jgi:hypothetical protein
MITTRGEISRRGRRAAALGLLLLAAPGSWSAATGPPESPVRRIEVLGERDALAAGEREGLAVRVVLSGEYHVNSHVPSEEYLIPTRLSEIPAEGIEWGEWIYPEGEMKSFSFSKTPLRIYEGTFLIRGSLRAAAGATPATRRLALELRYQSCTREKCLAPRTEKIPFEIRIVPSAAPTRRLHPDLFPAAPP